MIPVKEQIQKIMKAFKSPISPDKTFEVKLRVLSKEGPGCLLKFSHQGELESMYNKLKKLLDEDPNYEELIKIESIELIEGEI